MIVLGIDPGYATVGYGILQYEKNRFTPLAFGAITTPAGLPFSRRLEMIYDDINKLIEKFSPDVLSIEELFFTTNAKTGIAVAQARGVILLAAQKAGIPCFEYTPLQVKSAVTGYGKAEKKQVQELTRCILALDKVPKPDDTADALALAICHCHSSGSALSALYAGLK